MPPGFRGRERPANVIGNAVKVMHIATGEEADTAKDDGKNPAARSLGSLGGKARALKMSAAQRRKVARKAAEARWAKSPARAEEE